MQAAKSVGVSVRVRTGFATKRGFRLSLGGARGTVGLGSKEFIPPLL